MKNSNKFVTVAVVFLSICTKTYGIESKFNTSYRCVSNFAAGVNHSAEGHTAAEFYTRDEFRLTHFNDLKDSTLERWPRLASSHIVNDAGGGYYNEENAYFFRETDVSERNAIWLAPKCTAYGEEENGAFVARSIACHKSSYIFKLSTLDGSFSYAYIGSYDPTGVKYRPDGDKEKKYYGDSSVFWYGTCSPYYD